MTLAALPESEIRISEVIGAPRPQMLPSRVPDRLLIADAIRIICAAWVIWIHVPQSAELFPTTFFARFRLATFVILSTFFLFASQRAHPARGFGAYAASRFRVLYLPFLAWGVIYFVGQTLLFHGGSVFDLRPAFFLTGQTLHLWFLPFIFLAGLATFPLAQWVGQSFKHSKLLMVLAIFLGLVGSVLASPVARFVGRVRGVAETDPLITSIKLVPCIFLGMGLFILFRLTRDRSPALSKRLAIMGLLLFTSCIAVNCFIATNPLLESLSAMGVVLIAFWPSPGSAAIWLGKLGRYAYGMYLVHFAFVEGIHVFRKSILHLPPSAWYDMLTLLICIPLSLGTSMLLSRSRWTRWLIAAPAAAGENSSSSVRANGPVVASN